MIWAGTRPTSVAYNIQPATAGLVSPAALAEKRKVAIVIAFVAAAILTPPDVVSQLLLALPIIALYEISIIAARIIAPKDVGES